MHRSGNQKISQFVKADVAEGCDWTVYLDPRSKEAVASRIASVPFDAIRIPRFRRANATVALRVAAKLNGARNG